MNLKSYIFLKIVLLHKFKCPSRLLQLSWKWDFWNPFWFAIETYSALYSVCYLVISEFISLFQVNETILKKNKHIAMILISSGTPHKLLTSKFDKNLKFTSMENVNNPNPRLVFSSWSIEVKFKFLSNFQLKSLWGVPEDIWNMAICLFFIYMPSFVRKKWYKFWYD